VRLLARSLTALLSLAVLGGTAMGWVQLRQLDRSTPTAAVIDRPAAAPAEEQNILLVGLDSRSDAMGNPLPAPVLEALRAGGTSSGGDTTDTLIVVHVPAGGGRATAVSIPRDAYVDLGQGLGRHKINSAYSRASALATTQITAAGAAGTAGDGRKASRAPGPSPSDPAVVRAASAAGARATIGAVEKLTGLAVTRYAAVNLAGFADMSTAVGGVPVCLNQAVDDRYSGLSLPAGPQRVSGPEALAFVRQRHGLANGDLDRIARQQVFLAGATKQLLSTNTLADPVAVQRLVGVASRAITLDANWDLLAFARQMQGLSAGAVTFRTVPTGEISMPTSDGAAVEVDPDRVRTFVAAAIATDGADATDAADARDVAGPAPGATSVTPSSATPATAVPAGPTSANVPVTGNGPGAAPGTVVDETNPERVATAPVAASPVDTATPTPSPAPPPAFTAAAPGCVN
jgi:LCP family protein required for cell wall assembly